MELKPCPFCGGEALLYEDDNWYWEWRIHCSKCSADLGYYSTEKDAIAEWNRRDDNAVD